MDLTSQEQLSNVMAVRPSGLTQLGRLGLILAGLATFTIAVLNRAELFSETATAIFVPFAIGTAFILSGLAVGTRWQKPAFWFSVAMVGQTLTLQLINAGFQLRYQHYKPLAELLTYPTVLYAGALVIQGLVVGIGLRRYSRTLVTWARSNLRVWQAAVLGICFFVPTTTLSPEISRYISELIVAGILQLLSAVTFLLFALAIPESLNNELSRTIKRLGEKSSGPGTRYFGLVSVAAISVVAVAATLNIFSYERHPHVPDEVIYLVQANFFAEGRITMPTPLVPEAFDVYLMNVDGSSWYPITPPGWSMILAIGAFIGAPFIINPLLAGLNVLLAYWLLARLYSRPAARFAIILLAASPWFVFLGMSFMTHMAALTCLLVAAVGIVKSREAGNWKWSLLTGAALGFVSLIRPLEAVALAGLLGVWMLGVGGKRLSMASLTAVGVGTLLIGGLGLAFNAKLTGSPLQFPINQYLDETFGKNSNAYGFGPDRGMGWQLDPNPGHGTVDALINTNLNVSTLNTELLGWSIGSFLMIGAFLCFGTIRRSDLLMLALIAAIYVLHFFYYFSGGPDFSARYWFLMVVPLIALTVRGIEALADKLDETAHGARTRLYSAVGALVVLTVCVFIPWRAVDKYHNFRGMMPDVQELAAEFNFGRSLVLIQGTKHPDYDSAFVYNSVDLNGDGPVYAWDRDLETRQKLLAAYSDRPVWIVKGPSITGKAYQVAEGPLTPGLVTGVESE